MLVSSLLAAVAIVATPIVTASPINGTSQELSPPLGVACGRTSCFGEQVCCNPTCSLCAIPGMACPMLDCGHLPGTPAVTKPAVVDAPGPRFSGSKIMKKPRPTMPAPYTSPKPKDGVACGNTTCAADQVCCNASCGICTPPDGACIMMFCGDSHRHDDSIPS
ncbi:hypothetical protein MCOR04_004878 [Pyricularia oryzae]|nr:hypothetical protein MCOR17_001417 [Pyricularia oryzae]KAI6584699.1 hypothetical protein MCOR04_004878 [Pyricularia oryzae]